MERCSSTNNTSAKRVKSRPRVNRSIDAAIPKDAPMSCILRAVAKRRVSPISSSVTISERDSSARFSICDASHENASPPSFFTIGIRVSISAFGSTFCDFNNSSASSVEPSLTNAESFNQVRNSLCCGVLTVSNPSWISVLDSLDVSLGINFHASCFLASDSSSSPDRDLDLSQSFATPFLN